MQTKYLETGLSWLWVTVVVLVLDRITKLLALHNLSAYVSKHITPFLNLTLAYNKGAAFSFLGSQSGWQSWMFGALAIIVSAALLVWLKRLSSRERVVSIALCLIIGGALGNLWDRVILGYVVDFVDLHLTHWHWPVFNLADSAICLGAFLLIVDAVFKPKSS